MKVRSTRPPREAILRPINHYSASVELVTPEEGYHLDKPAYFMSEEGTQYLAVVGLLDEKIDLKITQSCEY